MWVFVRFTDHLIHINLTWIADEQQFSWETDDRTELTSRRHWGGQAWKCIFLYTIQLNMNSSYLKYNMKLALSFLSTPTNEKTFLTAWITLTCYMNSQKCLFCHCQFCCQHHCSLVLTNMDGYGLKILSWGTLQYHRSTTEVNVMH